jgi:hypothetical protein
VLIDINNLSTSKPAYVQRTIVFKLRRNECVAPLDHFAREACRSLLEFRPRLFEPYSNDVIQSPGEGAVRI